MRSTTQVLIIDDDEAVRQGLGAALAASSCSVHLAASGEEGLTQYELLHPDVVLLDVMLPQMSGLAVLRALKDSAPRLPVIVMTAYAEVQSAVQAIKLGAADYLQKPVAPDVLVDNLSRILARSSDCPQKTDGQVIGVSSGMKRAWRLVERFGPTDIPILLQGETGTGKGLVAEAIHRLSKRARAPFVAIDCATIPGDLAESELFGYEDGAFTGAGKRKRGRVAFADRGTLFLDEIGTLALGTQAKLLTLLEQQAFLPLGARSSQPTQINVRFVSATNVPLQEAAERGSFRADLFHRLNGVTIELPPLREREEDIELLARHFVAEFGAREGKPGLDIADAALDLLREYAWPGNVRELQRVTAVAAVLADSLVTPDDLPERLRNHDHARRKGDPVDCAPEEFPPSSDRSDAPINLRAVKEWAGREAQKRVILELQSRSNISRQELARLLGVDPKTLRARLKELAETAARSRQ